MKPKFTKLIQLIDVLADGEFHSGTKLGEHLSVSRTTINHYVSQLQELGVEVFSVTGRGYKVAKPLQLIDQQRLSRYFAASKQPANFLLERIVTSTNDICKGLAKESQLAQGFAVIAEAQTKGRGRRGKAWLSPFGSNLYVSLYWPLERGMVAAMGLSIAVGVALAEIMSAAGIVDVELKWPNDILISGKKIAGILVELEGQANGAADVIVGVGLNVDMPANQSAQIDQPWTDLCTVLSEPVNRNLWVAEVIIAIRTALQQFETDGMAGFCQRWQAFDRYYKQPVKLIMSEHKIIRGVAMGIDDSGALLIRRDGVTERYHAGEVSLRHDI